MNIVQKVFTIAAISMLAACSSSPQKGGGDGANDPEVTTDTAPGVGDAGNGVEVIPANGTQVEDGNMVDGQSLDDMKMTDVDSIYEPVIYFKYDQYELDDKATENVRYHANILLQNPKEKLILKGHTDERGTPEYNLALGEKRAKAVEQAMMLFGVDQSRIEVISFGEEQPAVLGSNELAWQKNRRVEIVIK
ncbi:peptidoglycan-associated lipoprotein Pal [Thiomicrorhabdus sp.]|uniref:peptidoglycan-associated lipoprotein Pal n=1 Tax=Thiomicrorhabdus sp. TaxID=2039724 RepID=UPI002AA92280|nr:peptidoglycan-associated lipoprotein Pal [Thiomicrorhabdus sp.]